jgi:predicted aldo/keto reductase-like oxidoreductase
MYLLHAMGRSKWEKLQHLGVLDWAERAIADGRIGHLGFSFHDDLSVFKEIVDAYDWTFCQIIYNYMDTEFQAGKEGLRFAAEKGLAVSIMEPLRGGQLARIPADSVTRIWDQASVTRTQVDWALQWLWNQPEVSVVLSGMSTMEQVAQNIASADGSGIGCLSPDELELYAQVNEALRALSPIPCSDCKYCQPCPQGVNIPGVFSMYNQKAIYGEEGAEITAFSDYGRTSKTAQKCVGCGECESACPQQIPIIEWLGKVVDFFAIEAR